MAEILNRFNEIVDALDLAPADGVAVELVRTYARIIDDTPVMTMKIGPYLLAALESLGMTPRSRAAIMKGASSAAAKPPTSPLDELRARRAARG